MKTKRTTSLTLIELPSQVPTALKSLSSRSVLLALTPHVQLALNKLGHECHIPEDFHEEEEINLVGLQNIDALEAFTEYTDNYLLENWDIFSQEGLRPVSLNWYYLKLFFNSISIRAFLIDKILRAINPGRVLFFDTRNERIDGSLFFGRESPWSRVIPLVCQQAMIPCNPLSDNTDASELWRVPGIHHGGVIPSLEHMVRSNSGSIGLNLARQGLRLRDKIEEYFKRPTPRQNVAGLPSLFFLDRSYSLGSTIQHAAKQQELNLYYWDGRKFVAPYVPEKCFKKPAVTPDTLTSDAKRLWRDLNNDHKFLELLTFFGINCLPAMRRRLQCFFELDIPKIASTYFEAIQLFNALKPSALVTSVLGDYRQKAFALAARKENVPVVVYRHGDSGAHLWGGGQRVSNWNNETRGRGAMYIEKNELPMADHVLAFGEGDAQFLNGIKKTDVNVVPVGSAVLDRLKLPAPKKDRDRTIRKFGLNPDKQTIMYVLSAMEGGVRAAPYQHRSPSLMFSIQKSIVDVFLDYPEIQLVVKVANSPFHPCSPIAQYISDQRRSNCRVISGSFTSVLKMADMFVIDVASTVFLEMLTTDKPILFCADQLAKKFDPSQWTNEVLSMWNERVSYSDNLPEFLQILHKRLNEESLEPVRSTDTLLKLFGTHKNDGLSVQRAYDFLKSLAYASVLPKKPESKVDQRE